MRIVRFQKESEIHIGILIEEGVIDLSMAVRTGKELSHLAKGTAISALAEGDLMELLASGVCTPEFFLEAFELLGGKSSQFFLTDKPKLLAPIPRPRKIIALGRNYAAHAKELGSEVPKEPIIFEKASTSVIGPEEPIVYPERIGRVDPEVELAVIMGKKARRVSKEKAMDFVAGYTVLNDVTARDMQKADIDSYLPWFRSKSLDTFCPIGPCMTLTDEIKEPIKLDLELKVNGEVRQKDNTANLIFKVPELIEFISNLMTLEPGDIIATGTPQGIKPIKSGDLVEATVEHIGTLRNPVVAEKQ